jgi:hypothetical protein
LSTSCLDTEHSLFEVFALIEKVELLADWAFGTFTARRWFLSLLFFLSSLGLFFLFLFLDLLLLFLGLIFFLVYHINFLINVLNINWLWIVLALISYGNSLWLFTSLILSISLSS